MIVIATCREYPEIGGGLALIVRGLIAKGQQVQCIPWQHENLGLFAKAKYVLPLCAWDYASANRQFRDWVVKVQAAGGVFLNSANTLLGNMKKNYLLALAEKGLYVTPSKYLEQPSIEQLRALKFKAGWVDMVIKPAYGQSGKLVTRYSADLNDDHPVLQSEGGIIAQPFIYQIKTQGELALCFIAGEFSHAVCRKPAKEDWRANSQYNVSVYPYAPDQSIIEQAAKSLQHLDQIPLYARVDGIVIDQQFMLCELELIEPALFFDCVADIKQTKFERLMSLLASDESFTG